MDKVKFNIKNVHVAPMTESGEVPVWGTPIKIPGAVSFALEPQGDVSPFYADGIVYYQSVANNGYAGDLEMALFPVEVLKAIFKVKEGTESKVLTENANEVPVPFAMMFEEDGDTTGTKFVLYNCTATRPSRSYATTTETKEPQTQTISVTAAPLENGNVMAMTGEETPDNIKETWYDAVYVESATEASTTSAEEDKEGAEA